MSSQSENSPTSSPADPFDGITAAGGRLSFASPDVTIDNDTGEEVPAYETRITADTLKGWYSSEKMHRHVVKVLGWVGKKKGYQSLQISPSDEDFQVAVEVLHKRIAGTAFAAILKYLGKEAVEDCILVFVGFAPVANALTEEIMEKNKAAKHEAEIDEKANDNGEK